AKAGPRRRQPHRGAPPALSCFVHLPRRKRGIAFHLFFMLSERVHRVMRQISAQPSGLSLERQRLVDYALKAGNVTLVKAPLVIRVPSRVFDPAAQVPRPARDFVNRKFRLLLFPCQKRLLKFVAEFFVRVQRQNPIAARRGSREVFLLREVRSEEHTSELQSPYDLVCRLLLEKKKKITT